MNEFLFDEVFRNLKTAYRAGREIDRLKGLLRFTPNREGVFIARCAPEYDILPAFAEHFTRRFRNENWAIIDEKRGRVLLRQKGKQAAVLPLDPKHPWFADGNEKSDPWENLWKNYHKSVNNESRSNPQLQKQFMPSRYWKYLPEMDTRHEK